MRGGLAPFHFFYLERHWLLVVWYLTLEWINPLDYKSPLDVFAVLWPNVSSFIKPFDCPLISQIGLIAFWLICSRSVGGKGEISFQIPKVKVPSIVIYALRNTAPGRINQHTHLLRSHIYNPSKKLFKVNVVDPVWRQKGPFDTIRLIPLITFSGVTTIHESGVFVTGGEGTLPLLLLPPPLLQCSYCSVLKLFKVLLENHLLQPCMQLNCCPPTLSPSSVIFFLCAVLWHRREGGS